MKPRAIFVETNWIVDIVAPAHLQGTSVRELLDRAEADEFELYLPAICLTEARETIPRRFESRSRSNDFRRFVRWARQENRVSDEDVAAAFRVFETFDRSVENELRRVPDRLNELRRNPRIHVFPLSEPMLERQVLLGSLDLFLKPYDLAILAAILVKAEELQRNGYSWVGFCDKDSDLQPWHKKTSQYKPIINIYNQARVWVYGDFLADDVEDLPDGWLDPTV